MEKKLGITGAVYMASGNSIRFQSNKLLVHYEGAPIYSYGLSVLKQIKDQNFISCPLEIIVISQYDVINYKAREMGIPYIKNKHSERGISETIRLGLSYFSSEVTQYLFLVADQPKLSVQTVSGLIKAYQQSKKTIACASFHNIPKNPVIFSSCYKEELMALKGDTGGKAVVKRHKDEVLLYETDEIQLMDLDDYEDLQRLIRLSVKSDDSLKGEGRNV